MERVGQPDSKFDAAINKLPWIGKRRQNKQKESAEKEAVHGLINTMVKKIYEDIAQGGYTVEREHKGNRGYSQAIKNQVVYIQGPELLEVELDAVETDMQNGNLHSQDLTLNISSAVHESDLPGGLSRHALVYKQIFTHPTGKKNGETELHEDFRFYKKVKYDLDSPDYPSGESGSGFVIKLIEMTTGEIIEFCNDILGASIDQETTQKHFEKSFLYWNSDSKRNEFQNIYMNSAIQPHPKFPNLPNGLS